MFSSNFKKICCNFVENNISEKQSRRQYAVAIARVLS